MRFLRSSRNSVAEMTGGTVGGEFVLATVARIAEIASGDWDRCAGASNPFVSHAFLSALEDSGSVGGNSGWQPLHATLRQNDRLVACAPLYGKSHSYGEYVFDHGWANAYQQAGGRYYPKLQCAVPFSPVPGPRLLVAPEAPDGAFDALAQGLVQLAQQARVSSLHITFPAAAEWQRLGELGYLKRLGTQFHWTNDGYADFEDFLSRLASRKRKQIRKERREALADGIEIRTLVGAEITEAHWAAFHRFYLATVDKKWGSAYLTRGFFPLMGERLGDRVVLIVAERAGQPIGAALNLRGADALYGRNWGADAEYPFLHFEACYYRAIDFAIAHKLKRVEAGAQGTHKIQRGYLPVPTYSAHWIKDKGFASAVANFLERETPAIEAEMAELATLSPFRENGNDG